MSKPKENKPVAGPKVSPVRTIVSLLLLLVVGVVCAIELRAGLGQFLTNKAFVAKSEDGAFSGKLSLDEAKAMVKLFPTETVHSDDETEKVFKYEWYSILRPLMGETSPQMYLASNTNDPPMATTFFTSPEEGAQFDGAAPSSGPADGSSPAAPSGGAFGAGGSMGPGGPGGGMRPGGGGPGGSRGQRPTVEGDEPAATDAPKADEPKADEPKADEPKADPPAADAPAADAPAADPPAADAPATDPPPSANN